MPIVWKFYTKKTVFMVFSNTKKTNDKILRVHFNNIQLERVFNCRYLGIILNFNLCDSLDMVRATGAFNSSFGFLFRKFTSLSIDVFYRLFLIHCTSFYASELWFNRYKCRHHFNKAAVSYFGDHFIGDVFNAFTF